MVGDRRDEAGQRAGSPYRQPHRSSIVDHNFRARQIGRDAEEWGKEVLDARVAEQRAQRSHGLAGRAQGDNRQGHVKAAALSVVAAGQCDQRRRVVAHGAQGRDDRAHTGASHTVDRQAGLANGAMTPRCASPRAPPPPSTRQVEVPWIERATRARSPSEPAANRTWWTVPTLRERSHSAEPLAWPPPWCKSTSSTGAWTPDAMSSRSTGLGRGSLAARPTSRTMSACRSVSRVHAETAWSAA